MGPEGGLGLVRAPSHMCPPPLPPHPPCAGAMLFNKRFTAAWAADGHRDYLTAESQQPETGKAVLSRLLRGGPPPGSGAGGAAASTPALAGFGSPESSALSPVGWRRGLGAASEPEPSAAPAGDASEGQLIPPAGSASPTRAGSLADRALAVAAALPRVDPPASTRAASRPAAPPAPAPAPAPAAAFPASQGAASAGALGKPAAAATAAASSSAGSSSIYGRLGAPPAAPSYPAPPPPPTDGSSSRAAAAAPLSSYELYGLAFPPSSSSASATAGNSAKYGY